MKRSAETVVLTRPLRDLRSLPEGGGPGAREEWEQRLRARYDEGFRDGQRELGEQLLRQRAELLEVQNGILDSLRQTLPRVRTDCETALVELALEVARKLIAGLPVSREMIEAAIQEALAQVDESGELTVLLHAEDLKLLRKTNSPLLPGGDGNDNRISFQASAEVTRGGCMVRTRFGFIDGRRDTKFELLARALRN